MNNRLLLNRRVKINDNYITLLNFIHPHYCIIKNYTELHNVSPYTNGIIYTGKYDSSTIKELNTINKNWIIVTDVDYEIDLSTNDGLVKNLLPLLFIKNSKNQKKQCIYNNIPYDTLLENVKYCLIDNTLTISYNDTADKSIFDLFAAIISTPYVLTTQYFITVTNNKINYVASSIYTFLCNVQSKNITNKTPIYSSLIMQSNARYGKYIKKGIFNYLNSKANKTLALYNLLMYLNKAR